MLKTLVFILIIIINLTACQSNNSPSSSNTTGSCDTIFIKDTLLQYTHTSSRARKAQKIARHFQLTRDPSKDSIAGQKVKFYLEQEACSGLAKDFYYGYWMPSDDFTTKDFLALPQTDKATLRPFYSWCLQATLLIADGALSELTGAPALAFVLQHPKDFLQWLEQDKTDTWYQQWVYHCSYSGLYPYFDNKKNLPTATSVQQQLNQQWQQHCTNCSKKEQQRLTTFVQDILQNYPE